MQSYSMSTRFGAIRTERSRIRLWLTGWAFWRQRGAIVLLLLATDLGALAATVLALLGSPRISHQLWIEFAILVTAALVQAEASLGIERLRRNLADSPHVNMTSVWTFAAVVALPLGLALLVTAIVYGHLWLRVWRRLQHRPAYRVIYGWAVVVCSVLASALVCHYADLDAGTPLHDLGWHIFFWLALAISCYSSVNSLLVLVFAYLLGARGRLNLWGTLGDNALEISTLAAGGITACILGTVPLLIALLMIPILLLHRGMLVTQLQHEASIDRKTGLYNTAVFNELAEKELARAQRAEASIGLLMVDLDHFKRVNDTWGHVAGDAVLVAVAEILVAETRDYDVVGRFGGEEFAVLLPQVNRPEVTATAERIRKRIAALAVSTVDTTGATIDITDLTTSVGAVHHPARSTTIEDLVIAADHALYDAKNGGRNRVVARLMDVMQ